jgi:putative MATE family efflux protein
MNLYNLVDQIFIGQKVGMLGNAATNVAFPLTTICIGAALLVGIGSSARFGLELGRENPEIAKKSAGNALVVAIIIGLIIAVIAELFLEPMLYAFSSTEAVLPYAVTYVRWTAIGYPLLVFGNISSALIRADGSPKDSMVCMLCGCITNIVLDPVLMFGLDMGMDGAAIATVISQAVGFCVGLRYFFHMKQVKLDRDALKPDLHLVLRNMTLGLSNCLTQVAILVVQIVVNNSLNYYGALSVYGADIALSAFGILMKVNSIVIGIYVGIVQGLQPILSFNYGAKQYERVKKSYYIGIRIALIIGAVAMVMYECFPRQIMSLFGNGSELYFQFSILFMRVFLCTVILAGIQMISSNFFAAIGMPAKGAILAMCRQIIFFIPVAVIFPLFMGVEGLMFSGPISDVASAIISLLFVHREFRRMIPQQDRNRQSQQENDHAKERA